MLRRETFIIFLPPLQILGYQNGVDHLIKIFTMVGEKENTLHKTLAIWKLCCLLNNAQLLQSKGKLKMHLQIVNKTIR